MKLQSETNRFKENIYLFKPFEELWYNGENYVKALIKMKAQHRIKALECKLITSNKGNTVTKLHLC